MRVQHNIMAMGAYRNYTNNVNSMKKNLERLSSGYKINRAGDDAAGLAISEKMRAQITGLETAQKNAKDGISLVQTAEGALTEVHDMLNRMVELATQSANGTYDNTTDRFQLQKEVNQLMDEINRIADSANFNGIQLLDGSMAIRDAVAASSTTNTELINGMDRIIKTLAGSGDKAYEVNGKKTVLDSTTGKATRAVFQIDFTTMKFTTSATLANGTIGGTITVNIGGTAITIKGSAIGGLSTSMKANATIESKQIATALINMINNATVGTKPDWVNLTVDDTGAITDRTVTINGVEWRIASGGDGIVEFTQKDLPTTADEARANFDVEVSIQSRDGDKLEIKLVDDKDKPEVEGEYSIKFGTYVKTYGIAKADANKAHTIFEIRESDIKDGTKIAIGSWSIVLSVGADTAVREKTGNKTPTKSGATSTSGEIIVKLDAGDNLNTALGKISKQIGSTFNMYYVDPADGKQKSAKFQIGVNDGTNGGPVGLAIQRIKEYDPENGTGSTAFAFDTLEKLAQNFKMEVTSTTTTEAKDATKGLSLQIGDTAESYNQLVVSIEDCHTDAIGIGGISIADQESAQAAVDAIKAAINYVSDVRGTLGATQNRLDHTINNLSVMTENIQDAESTIRDTDIAEEMMAYTKNNILIQASQAMLAQANQVPQGVLQLLQ